MASGITIDGNAVFGSGPAYVIVGELERDVSLRAYPGLDGLFATDMGRRGRRIAQGGTLQGASHADLNGQIAAIEAYQDGQIHVLADDQAHAWYVLLLHFRPEGRRLMAHGGGDTHTNQDYRVEYLCLDP